MVKINSLLLQQKGINFDRTEGENYISYRVLSGKGTGITFKWNKKGKAEGRETFERFVGGEIDTVKLKPVFIDIQKKENRLEIGISFMSAYPEKDADACLFITQGERQIKKPLLSTINFENDFVYFDNGKIKFIYTKNIFGGELDMCEVLKSIKKIEFGSETHGRRSFILYVPEKYRDILDENGRLQFPMIGYRLYKINNYEYLIVKDPAFIVVNLSPIWKGYRGSSSYECIDGCERVDEKAEYYEYRSPRGSLGVYQGMLISIRKGEGKVVYQWRASGRMYGEPNVLYVYINRQDGSIDMCDTITTPEELLEMVEKLEGGR